MSRTVVTDGTLCFRTVRPSVRPSVRSPQRVLLRCVRSRGVTCGMIQSLVGCSSRVMRLNHVQMVFLGCSPDLTSQPTHLLASSGRVRASGRRMTYFNENGQHCKVLPSVGNKTKRFFNCLVARGSREAKATSHFIIMRLLHGGSVRRLILCMRNRPFYLAARKL